ncbi:hypothetical protein BG006_005546 [Podila minutissima]|uniref:Carbohydrate-binding module family 96 domain-containing protein n=1 Tax=Podila minutissima TaxID=64525 RepID=A0A9P5SNW3_9FUNG|nr:hypothetical protein BG006_005546 [Podila minutissima]
MLFRASILSTLTVLAIVNVSHTGLYITEATTDATIMNSVLKTCKACPRSECSLCSHGYDDTLVISSNPKANPKLRSTLRALIDFKLPDVPVNEIEACYLEFPDFTRQRNSPIELKFAYTGSNDWDEGTVNGRNAPDITITFKWTEACTMGEIDGEFSIFIEAVDGIGKIPSRNSGEPALLHVMTSEIDYEFHN